MTFWFFATPIIYPSSIQSRHGTPSRGLARRQLLQLNPFTHLAITYQEILYFKGRSGTGFWLLVLGVISVAFFFFGYFVFDRLRDTFAEEV